MRHWSGYESDEAAEGEDVGETSKEGAEEESRSTDAGEGGTGTTPEPIFREDLPSVGLVHVHIPNQRALYNGHLRLDSLLSMRTKAISQVRRGGGGAPVGHPAGR